MKQFGNYRPVFTHSAVLIAEGMLCIKFGVEIIKRTEITNVLAWILFQVTIHET